MDARPSKSDNIWTVVDLFSGCGGMSAGFARRQSFRMLGAVDLEYGKPCAGAGALDCNQAYSTNIGVQPFGRDIATTEPADLAVSIRTATGHDLAPGDLTVLSACPPCTDFSRAKPGNHRIDGERNTQVARCGDFVEFFRPEFVVMENARELIRGHHTHHAEALLERLAGLGYDTVADVHMLTCYGLAQARERALIIASRVSPVRSLADLWHGYTLDTAAITVRRALSRLGRWHLRVPEDPMQVSPGMSDAVTRRLQAIPHDGGSWADLVTEPARTDLLTPSMTRRWVAGDLGSHPDVYGRMRWDAPAPTIKRECAHVGNGRYAHPVEDRLLTVREMASIQGFPFDYAFPSRSIANRYRHIGDAVPPIVSYQLSALVAWMKTGVRPAPEAWILPNSTFTIEDLQPVRVAAAA